MDCEVDCLQLRVEDAAADVDLSAWRDEMTFFIGRRKFITLLGSAAAAWPLTAPAQQPMSVVGFLDSRADNSPHSSLAAFHRVWSQWPNEECRIEFFA